MEVIVVSGQAHNSGKTTVASMVIKNLKGRAAAIKCSLHEGADRIVSAEPAVILMGGTDTARFAASGADPVVFLQTGPEHLKEDLGMALELAGEEQEYLVIEGNRVLDYLNPDLILFVTCPGAETKPSAVRAEAKADIAVDLTSLLGDPGLQTIPFQFRQGRLSCSKAHLLAKVTGISMQEMGKQIDEQGIRVKHCQLGLFS